VKIIHAGRLRFNNRIAAAERLIMVRRAAASTACHAKGLFLKKGLLHGMRGGVDITSGKG